MLRNCKYLVFSKLQPTKYMYNPINFILVRRHHCLQTLFLLLKLITSVTKESLVTRTNR